MSFVLVLQEYFRGERQTGIALAVVGACFLGGAYWLYRAHTGGFAWGLLVPLALVGLAFTGGGIFLAQRSDRQITELAARYESNPDSLLSTEVPRMARVNANWPILKAVWSVLIVAALVLLQIVRRDWSTGLGLALLAILTVLFFTDVFGQRRGAIYGRALEEAQAAQGQGR